MVRRKKKRSGSKRGGSLLVVAVAGVAGYLAWCHRALIEAYTPHLLIAGATVIVFWFYRVVRRHRIASTLSEIDAMDGHEFERFLVRLFRRLGYRARNVGGQGGDFGADLIVEKDGARIAVQAKNYLSGRVGNDAVQQAIAGATYYDCQEAMVVTNAMFTRAASEQAKGCSLFPVTLWNRRDLERIICQRRRDF